ncbi:Alpha/beta hydrolase [Mycena sanguinolenta]|uniref:Alpha/beta hydrolase n=1 Tax=Mycena sanguinolenta TaxID=230812 RepID=A0A8H6XZS7_9AGAR|nr:Alpha/beta hydrolase [Mycena sanguinolenta]
MPRIDLQTSTGSESFAYTISTPTQDCAESIEQGVPTILLIHPSYTLSAIFHPMFEDPRLRRFNLVAMDLRGHGGTTAKVEDTFTTEIAAEDFLALLDALEISACHVAGVSFGASIALEMAIIAAEKVLSLFMLSPPPFVEPAGTLEGRKEIFECWKEGLLNSDNVAFEDALVGGIQLAYNGTETPFSKALGGVILDSTTRIWAKDHLDIMYTVTVRYLENQAPQDASALARVRCPVLLLHCSADLAYTLESAEELLSTLRAANVDAKLDVLEGAPHMGNVTHPTQVNVFLYDFISAHCPVSSLPQAPTSVQSPFLEELTAFGLLEDEDAEMENSIQTSLSLSRV